MFGPWGAARSAHTGIRQCVYTCISVFKRTQRYNGSKHMCITVSNVYLIFFRRYSSFRKSWYCWRCRRQHALYKRSVFLLSAALPVIVCCVYNICKSYERILMKFCGDVGVGRGPGNNHLDFSGYPDFYVDPELFSRGFFAMIGYFCSVSQQVMSGFWLNFLKGWDVGAWSKDQSIRFWWRSGSGSKVSESG